MTTHRTDGSMDDPYDCLVVGGGPAGLTAAIYLARFHLSVLVVDSGRSRARSIPWTRNHAGFPEGISGAALLARMAAQAARFGATALIGEVATLARDGALVIAQLTDKAIISRAVLLATGVVNHRPNMAEALHDEAVRRGALRYCPICDGFEVTDRAIAVIGTGDRGLKEALFLRSYTADIALIAPGAAHDLSGAQQACLIAAGIRIVDEPYRAIALTSGGLDLVFSSGTHSFASVYPALGSDIRSGLAAGLGARRTDEGCLTVDDHQRTSAPGLYAAGDVVLGLDQISHAMGEGGVAATTIRNDLAEHRAIMR